MQLVQRTQQTDAGFTAEMDSPPKPQTISDQQLLEALQSEGPIIVSLPDGTKRLIRTRPENLRIASLPIEL